MDIVSKYISIDPEIRFGKPCIKNTRITVEDILTWLASDMTHDEICEDYPQISKDHILAALKFASQRESSLRLLTS